MHFNYLITTTIIFTASLVTFFTTLKAEKIVVTFGSSIPPYVIKGSNEGIEYDIIKESLSYRGYQLEPKYIPFVNIKDAFLEKSVDATATIEKTVGIKGYYSDRVLSYHNYAITLKDNNINIKNIYDLSHKRIIAFQLATLYLGSEFSLMAKNNPLYREKSDQNIQAKYLLENKTDVAISDKNIFLYYKNKLSKVVDTSKPIKFHNIFPRNDFSVVFKSAKVRNAFNEGLKSLKLSGRYYEIFKHYIPNVSDNDL